MGTESSSEGKCACCAFNGINAILTECAYEDVLDPSVLTMSKADMIKKKIAVYACINGHYLIAKRQFKTM